MVVFQIVSVVWTRASGSMSHRRAAAAGDYSNTAELGKVLYTDYVYPFELAAVLLLIAIVAAISLTMRKRPGLKLQNIAKQVAVRAPGPRANREGRRHAARSAAPTALHREAP